jgi:hypothetical protein
MRSRDFVLCALVVIAVGLLAAPVGAQNWPPFECTTGSGEYGTGDALWTIEVVAGPVKVDCDFPFGENNDEALLVANPGGDCTGIQYAFSMGSSDKAYILAQPPLAESTMNQLFNAKYEGPCVGQTTKAFLGVNSCHETAVTLTPAPSKNDGFAVIGFGNRALGVTTVGVTKGNDEGYCAIAGLGLEQIIPDGCVPSCGPPLPHQSNIRTEVINFDGCFAQFEFDLTNGSLLDWGSVCEFADNPAACCLEDDYSNDVFCGCDPLTEDCCNHEDYTEEEVFYLTVPNPEYPDDPNPYLNLPVEFGDGSFGVGEDSCTCRLIKGQRMCWGTNCPLELSK